jgi:hypothetical protein
MLTRVSQLKVMQLPSTSFRLAFNALTDPQQPFGTFGRAAMTVAGSATIAK